MNLMDMEHITNNGDVYKGEWKNGKKVVKEYLLGSQVIYMRELD